MGGDATSIKEEKKTVQNLVKNSERKTLPEASTRRCRGYIKLENKVIMWSI
jgi:hypothetical protein